MFGFGRINFKILDFNKLGLFRFQMSELSLFHPAITDGKKRILEDVVFYNKLWDVRISCSMIRLFLGIMLKRYSRDFSLVIFKKVKLLRYQRLC